ncbi:MAG: hpt [Caulobacteraceae bacterium]|jgi:hypoxanthine phosphoribosyltransferase|nr:hpt [Caulobacteraceae bacterium]
MADLAPRLEVLLDRESIAARVNVLAERIAPDLGQDAVAICLLTGGLWFAADLTRALAALGKAVAFDALWLASYGDGAASAGRCEVRAGLQRPVTGRPALVIDDVFDTGLSLEEAVRHVRAAGAASVSTAVFARKPWPLPRPLSPDYVAWEAPGRFLVGYGMDYGGAYRGLPYVAALALDDVA